MGSGRWDNTTYVAYASASNLRSTDLNDVFTSRDVPDTYKSANIGYRESRDSADNPNSTPVILGLDVTGSMGKYAGLIAQEELPKLMESILDTKVVPDPHIMFMGIDDVKSSRDRALQVSQFEADIRIVQALREIYLVGLGGGNDSESYDLAWYFAGTRCQTDAWDKRKQKGFLFTMGDEMPPTERVSEREYSVLFSGDQPRAFSPEEALKLAQEQWAVFHIVIEEGSFARRALKSVRQEWKRVLGPNALYLRQFTDLTDVVLATIRIHQGEDINEVIAESQNKEALVYAFHNALRAGHQAGEAAF